MLMGTLTFISVALTCTMFATRQAVLGFACALFWFVLSGYAYTQSVNPWVDIYYYMFFASAGMAIFTMMAAFGLRDKQKSIGEEEMEKGDEKFIDEDDKLDKNLDNMFGPEGEKTSRRTRELRERAEKRRNR